MEPSLNMSGRHTGVWVVCAAYNEAATIARVVSDLERGGYQVVVVDDGSTDGTRHVASAAGAGVITHPINPGPSAPLQTGIEYALSRAPHAIGTFHADGQHRVPEIPRLI